MPQNIGSIRVLEKAGFHKEGLSKQNVKINGKWEDHLQNNYEFHRKQKNDKDCQKGLYPRP
ncbi:Ribosomal-protein-S5p-alanine acetyltransferase [Bacillus smithii]|nr:Ribosomal-protein-S5p-alanine acetyltransferase [Bacillus smithii]